MGGCQDMMVNDLRLYICTINKQIADWLQEFVMQMPHSTSDGLTNRVMPQLNNVLYFMEYFLSKYVIEGHTVLLWINIMMLKFVIHW